MLSFVFPHCTAGPGTLRMFTTPFDHRREFTKYKYSVTAFKSRLKTHLSKTKTAIEFDFWKIQKLFLTSSGLNQRILWLL